MFQEWNLQSFQFSRFGRETPDFQNFFQSPELSVKSPNFYTADKYPER